MNDSRTLNQGTDISIKESVVDFHFLYKNPPTYKVPGTGDDSEIVIEVVTRLSSKLVGGHALIRKKELAIHSSVIDTGEPLKAPVDNRIFGRVFNTLLEKDRSK